ncbi:MAG: NAD(P)/FAD-dependent oxidoreductase [Candidatus Woesearchaeota archaeon]
MAIKQRKNQQKKKVIVIGAGPVGSTIAYLLAKQGFIVHVYEEHPTIGMPIQCTGILSTWEKNWTPIPKNVIANNITTLTISTGETTNDEPARKTKTTIRLQTPETIVHRQKFDTWLAMQAAKAKVKYFLNHQFIGIRNHNQKQRVFHERKEKNKNTKNTAKPEEKNDEAIFLHKTTGAMHYEPYDLLIGCDGVNSKTQALLEQKKPLLYLGMQAVAKAKGNAKEMQSQARKKSKKKDDNNTQKLAHQYDTYFSKTPHAYFGWIVPEGNDYFRIGIASKHNHAKACFDHFFEGFCKQNAIQRGYEAFEIVSWQSGCIPSYDPKRIIAKGKLAVLGDAATQVKATTLGGIIPGIKAAHEFAARASHALHTNQPLPTLKNKDLAINQELLLHLLLRNILEEANPKHIQESIALLNNSHLQELLQTVPRDEFSKHKGKLIMTGIKVAAQKEHVLPLLRLFALSIKTLAKTTLQQTKHN